VNQTILRHTEGGIIYFPQDEQEARVILATHYGKRLEIVMFIKADHHIFSNVIATIAVDGLSFNCRKYRGRNWWHAGMLDSIFSIKVGA
jgi:hypothetical protein